MRTAFFRTVALLGLLFSSGPAVAQLPTATGKSITMSNAAWKIFIPSTFKLRADNKADLLVHFHGDPQTYWNNAKYANLNTIIVTVNYSGLSSVYTTPFSNAALFQSVIDEALTKVRAEATIPDTLTWDKLGVSSFSAGYGAVREILKSATYRNDIDVLLAADSLYASTAGDGTPVDSQLVDYKTFAGLAKNGTKTFLYSHSQVVTNVGPSGYESTYECADEIMQSLGITTSAYNVNGLGTLNFYRHVKSGNFELWGALGADGDSHLEHLRYIGEFLKVMPLAKIPEPSSLVLAGLGAALLGGIRRRRSTAAIGRLMALALAFAGLLFVAGPAAAQIPTATGTSITMSNTAWKIFIPSTFKLRPDNKADLLIHFHGDPQTMWNNAKYAKLNSIVLTVNYSGFSSVYTTPFSNQALFQSVIDEARTTLRAQSTIPDDLVWDKLAVSSFSAGYGAVREILKNQTYRDDIDALVAADSLYATTSGDGTPLNSQMADYTTFANLAKAGSKMFLYSHSQVVTNVGPSGYESTYECADELMQNIGVAPSAYNVAGLGTLTFYRHAKAGNFELWGATGSDAPAHSKHLQYIGGLLEKLPLAKVPGPGDFSGDGKVDAADYVLWRDSYGRTGSYLMADGSGNNVVDIADYNLWKTNFGASAGTGGISTVTVPEPSSWVLAWALAGLGTLARLGGMR